jgi:transcriptional regulator with XRE-family HTH domain
MKRTKPYKIDYKALGARLKRVRKHLRLNQAQLGEIAGLSKTTICDYEVGKTPPGFKFITLLSERYNVNINYIISGEGPMFRDESQFPWNKPGEKLFGDYNREVAQMLDYMGKSPMFLLAVVTMVTDFLNKNAGLIARSIDLERAKRKEKDDAAAQDRQEIDKTGLGEDSAGKKSNIEQEKPGGKS